MNPDSVTVELTGSELAIILDGLAALPLSRAYNVFNKLLAEHNKLAQATTNQPSEPKC